MKRLWQKIKRFAACNHGGTPMKRWSCKKFLPDHTKGKAIVCCAGLWLL